MRRAVAQLGLFDAPAPVPPPAPAANDALDPQLPSAVWLQPYERARAEEQAVPPPAPPPVTEEQRRALEDLALLGPASAHELAEKTGRGTPMSFAEALAALVPHGFVERHEKGWACTLAGFDEMARGRGLPAPVVVDEAPAPAPADDPEDPAAIAADIQRDLHEAAARFEGVEAGLRGDPADAWAVFIAVPGDVQPPPLLVRAAGRFAAERDAARSLRVKETACFALPAHLFRSGAVPIAEHPLCPPPDAPPPCLADLIETTLESLTVRVEGEVAELKRANAEVLGSEERRAAQRAEEAQVRATQKAEARAQRQPAPKGKRAKVAPGAAPIDAGQRQLTERQRELLALLDVDPRTNRVVYTRDEHLPDWASLKQVVELLGGVYKTAGKKTKGGWVFPDDVDALDMVRTAIEDGSILDPKLLGFYPTSDALADALVARLDLRPGDRVLEPSAGDGAIARAVRRACPEAQIACVELLPENRAKLAEQGFVLIGEDFLALRPEDVGCFDVVVDNPPFGKSRPEIAHVLHAIRRFLRADGRLGMVMPQSLTYRDDAATVELREELGRIGAVIEENPPRSFRAVGTMIKTVSVWVESKR